MRSKWLTSPSKPIYASLVTFTSVLFQWLKRGRPMLLASRLTTEGLSFYFI